MIKIGSIVECIKGTPGILTKGDTYTIYFITPSGNFLLEEINPPSGYTSFDNTRFKDTQLSVFTQMREYFSNIDVEEVMYL